MYILLHSQTLGILAFVLFIFLPVIKQPKIQRLNVRILCTNFVCPFIFQFQILHTKLNLGIKSNDLPTQKSSKNTYFENICSTKFKKNLPLRFHIYFKLTFKSKWGKLALSEYIDFYELHICNNINSIKKIACLRKLEKCPNKEEGIKAMYSMAVRYHSYIT